MPTIPFNIDVELRARGTSSAPTLEVAAVEHIADLAEELESGPLRDGVFALIHDWKRKQATAS